MRRRDDVIKSPALPQRVQHIAIPTAAASLVWIYLEPVTTGTTTSVGGTSFALAALAAAGLLVYGLLIPAHLHAQLAAADAAHLLNSPGCRHRYGFLFVRFKPGRWGAEFRILWRKTLQLLVTTFLAEQPRLNIPAQLLVLGWAIRRQYVEHPFAELGSARAAFVEAHPAGDGWSRGDYLELLSLGAQLVNVLLIGLCAAAGGSGGWLGSGGTDAVGALMCCFVLAPLGYAGRILQQERRAAKAEGATTLTATPSSMRADDGGGGNSGGDALLVEAAQTANPLTEHTVQQPP